MIQMRDGAGAAGVVRSGTIWDVFWKSNSQDC